MSVKIIFDALEANIKANTTFQGFKFFRFDSIANANKQSQGSVPFIRVVWKQNRSYIVENTYKLETECKFYAEIRWQTISADLDNIARITEYSLYDRAFKECLLPRDEALLGLDNVLSLQVDTLSSEVTGAAALKHCILQCNCEVKYIEIF